MNRNDAVVLAESQLAMEMENGVMTMSRLVGVAGDWSESLGDRSEIVADLWFGMVGG